MINSCHAESAATETLFAMVAALRQLLGILGSLVMGGAAYPRKGAVLCRKLRML
jgi:hypothetical protein